ncbi:hypothetical protein LX88_006465 [Lentzea californiensis]|nr:hypothetical protein [Lentzea californiensis]
MLGKLLLAVSLLMPVVSGSLTVHTGQIDGAEYRVEVPSPWNGTLLLYSHGTYPAGYTPPIEMASRPAARADLLKRGYALAASRYSVPHGHSVPDALRDQPALVSWFSGAVGRPRRVIAWGSSLGGLTSVVLGERGRFDGVLALCGALGGAVERSNQLLDLGFVIRTLLQPSLEVVRISDVASNETRAVAAVDAALGSGDRTRPAGVGQRRSGYPCLVTGARTPSGGSGGGGDAGSRSRPNARQVARVGQRPRRHRGARRWQPELEHGCGLPPAARSVVPEAAGAGGPP